MIFPNPGLRLELSVRTRGGEWLRIEEMVSAELAEWNGCYPVAMT